jgi:hypothetical protein
VITLMETFNVVMVYKFFNVLFAFRCCDFCSSDLFPTFDDLYAFAYQIVKNKENVIICTFDKLNFKLKISQFTSLNILAMAVQFVKKLLKKVAIPNSNSIFK